MKPDRKKINYRGGVVRFPIPSDWVEEYEPEGGGTFYADNPDSGTLRLNVLGFESPNKAAEEMARDAFKQHAVLCHRSGFAMRRYVWPAEENGETLNIHRWEIAVPVPPHCLRLVLFAYTAVAGQQGDSRIATELQTVDECISAAEFSQITGVTGAFYHDGHA